VSSSATLSVVNDPIYNGSNGLANVPGHYFLFINLLAFLIISLANRKNLFPHPLPGATESHLYLVIRAFL